MHHSFACCFLFSPKRSFSPGRTGGFQPLPDSKNLSKVNFAQVILYSTAPFSISFFCKAEISTVCAFLSDLKASAAAVPAA